MGTEMEAAGLYLPLYPAFYPFSSLPLPPQLWEHGQLLGCAWSLPYGADRALAVPQAAPRSHQLRIRHPGGTRHLP